MVRYMHHMKQGQRVSPTNVGQEMLRLCTTFNVATMAAGISPVPKNHSFLHMTANIADMGNPAWYSTYEDESENGFVAKVGRSAHPLMFPFTVLVKLDVKRRYNL